MSTIISQSRSGENFRRRELTLYQKAYELAEFPNVEVAVIIFKKNVDIQLLAQPKMNLGHHLCKLL